MEGIPLGQFVSVENSNVDGPNELSAYQTGWIAINGSTVLVQLTDHAISEAMQRANRNARDCPPLRSQWWWVPGALCLVVPLILIVFAILRC